MSAKYYRHPKDFYVAVGKQSAWTILQAMALQILTQLRQDYADSSEAQLTTMMLRAQGWTQVGVGSWKAPDGDVFSGEEVPDLQAITLVLARTALGEGLEQMDQEIRTTGIVESDPHAVAWLQGEDVTMTAATAEEADAFKEAQKKWPRNAPCICGSGLKFKKCCGQ
jgi:uncharacterized protein YecA (UPF0149 family)